MDFLDLIISVFYNEKTNGNHIWNLCLHEVRNILKETDVKNYTKVFQMSIFVKHTSENLHKSGPLKSGALFLKIINLVISPIQEMWSHDEAQSIMIGADDCKHRFHDWMINYDS